jgi:zinc protease
MRIASYLFMTLLFALTGNISSAQQSSTDKLPMDPKVRQGKLDNGLTYYIRENKKPEKKVELRLVIQVGSIMEDDDQRGLAHMAEHMAFNGTKNFKKNEIVSFLQDIGVGFGNDLNAYTSFDETVYILPIPTEKPANVEKGFQVLEDWAHQVTYLDEDINSERAIILEESRLGKSGEERMFNKVYPELFKGSKYAERLPIGKDSIIKNFNPDAIRRFYREWYRPDLMAVVVVGDISPAEAMNQIIKHFGKLKNPPTPRPRVYAEVPPYQTSHAMVVTDKEATSYQFSLHYSATPQQPVTTYGDYQQELIKDLYTTMLNARFRELSQKENPPFVYAYVNFDSYARNHEAFSVVASTGTNDIRKGADAAAIEIERVKRFGFTQAELDRAKKNLIAGLERAYNNRDKTESADLAAEYVEHFTNEKTIPGIEKEYEYLTKILPLVSLAEVNKVTEKYRDQTNRFAYVMGPESTPGIVLPTGMEMLAGIDAMAKTSGITPYEEKTVAASLMTTLPKSGKIVSKSINTALGTTELKLSNGITVSLKQTDFKADQIILTGSRYGGIGGYGLSDKYSAENTSAMVAAMGVGEFSPIDMRKVLAGKAASASSYISQTEEGFRGSSGKKDLETMFQLVYLNATAPRRDSSLFKSTIQRNKAQYTMMGANPQFAFIDTTVSVLYKNNPLAQTAVPKAEHFDKIDMDRALAIYKERFSDLSGMHFIIVGSFTDAEIIPLIETYVASLPASGKKTNYVDNKVRPMVGNKTFTFEKGKDDKSLILAIYNGEAPYSVEQSRKIAMLSEIMNIKIIEEMREKIQGIYGGGTSGSMEKVPYPKYGFVLQLPCGPEKVDTLLKAFYHELNDLATKGPEQKYLDKVKKQWMEGYKTDIKTNEFWLSKLQQINKGESTTAQFLNWEKQVNSITPADVRSAAILIQKSTTKLVAIQMPQK